MKLQRWFTLLFIAGHAGCSLDTSPIGHPAEVVSAFPDWKPDTAESEQTPADGATPASGAAGAGPSPSFREDAGPDLSVDTDVRDAGVAMDIDAGPHLVAPSDGSALGAANQPDTAPSGSATAEPAPSETSVDAGAGANERPPQPNMTAVDEPEPPPAEPLDPNAPSEVSRADPPSDPESARDGETPEAAAEDHPEWDGDARNDDEPEQEDDEPARAGQPRGSGQGPNGPRGRGDRSENGDHNPGRGRNGDTTHGGRRGH